VAGEYFYNAPTFDGDSIFNVFATYAYQDARLTYTAPELGPWHLWGSTFYRKFDDSSATFGVSPVTDSGAFGVAAGARYRISERGYTRVDLYYDDGFGGLRAGGDLSGRYQLAVDRLEVEGRLTLLRFEPDIERQKSFPSTSFGVQAGARYRMADGVRLHLLVEENNNAYYNYQLRAIALLDLTFLR
jgi:hypothetical protein